MHAWYSQKAEERCGAAIYEREDGTEVAVTFVAEDESFAGLYHWPDKRYVGEVVKCVKPIDCSAYDWMRL